MMEVQPIPDAMLAELAQRYQYAGTPWNCRRMPLSESDREYMYMLYYGMQGLVARLRLAEKERDFAKTEIARLHDDIRELTDVRVLDEEDRDLLAWLQGTSTKPEPSMPPPDIYVSDTGHAWDAKLNPELLHSPNATPYWARPAPSIPEGWKLVPIVSTAEMDNAGAEHCDGYLSVAEAVWDAMLAATPEAKP